MQTDMQARNVLRFASLHPCLCVFFLHDISAGTLAQCTPQVIMMQRHVACAARMSNSSKRKKPLSLPWAICAPSVNKCSSARVAQVGQKRLRGSPREQILREEKTSEPLLSCLGDSRGATFIDTWRTHGPWEAQSFLPLGGFVAKENL